MCDQTQDIRECGKEAGEKLAELLCDMKAAEAMIPVEFSNRKFMVTIQEVCIVCGQVWDDTTPYGEYPCVLCDMPTVH